MSALSLDKPLPELPDEQTGVAGDVSMDDFEGYLDILAYSQRGLPSGPDTESERRSEGRITSPAQDVVSTVPKEDEWMSTRPESQLSSTNTVSASSDEARRIRSRPPSGALTLSTSVSGKTVTPMSSIEFSIESEWEVRGTKRALCGPGVAARIEEVSEPGTASPTLTPKHHSTAALNICYHCGRDPSGKDAKGKSGSPMTVLEISGFTSQDERETEKGISPVIIAQDNRGRRYTLDPETSHFRVLDETEESEEEAPQEPENGAAFVFPSPPGRPPNPDPYATTYSSPDELPSQRHRAEFEVEVDVEAFGDLETTPRPLSNVTTATAFHEPLSSLQQPTLHSTSSPPNEKSVQIHGRKFGTEIPRNTSFWKNPDGVILVYQGIDVGGKELYYGSDINFLGSFHDDDEGSSGLGSTRNSSNDLAGTGGGLAMIPEVVGSDDLWDD